MQLYWYLLVKGMCVIHPFVQLSCAYFLVLFDIYEVFLSCRWWAGLEGTASGCHGKVEKYISGQGHLALRTSYT